VTSNIGRGAPGERFRLTVLTVALIALSPVTVMAQAPSAVSSAFGTQPVPPPAVTGPAPKAKPATLVVPRPASPAIAVPGQSRCTRLPLSDIKLGREETIASARFRLDEYAAAVAKKRGWRGTKKSDETVSCADYLYLPLLGQEYKCLVTATFCPT
jgi:hypothetical protein